MYFVSLRCLCFSLHLLLYTQCIDLIPSYFTYLPPWPLIQTLYSFYPPKIHHGEKRHMWPGTNTGQRVFWEFTSMAQTQFWSWWYSWLFIWGLELWRNPTLRFMWDFIYDEPFSGKRKKRWVVLGGGSVGRVDDKMLRSWNRRKIPLTLFLINRIEAKLNLVCSTNKSNYMCLN